MFRAVSAALLMSQKNLPRRQFCAPRLRGLRLHQIKGSTPTHGVNSPADLDARTQLFRFAAAFLPVFTAVIFAAGFAAFAGFSAFATVAGFVAFAAIAGFADFVAVADFAAFAGFLVFEVDVEESLRVVVR